MNLHAYPAWHFILPRECVAGALGFARRPAMQAYRGPQ